jgi:AAA+ superfamily predicted ATPase
MHAASFLELQLALWTERLDQRAESSEPSSRAAILEDEISRRIGRDPQLPESRLRSRLGLSDNEASCVWLLVTAALSPSISGIELTIDSLRRAVYPDSMLAALRELGPDGVLRRLRLIERADGGGPNIHESQWTWTVSRRLVAFLLGDESTDPQLATLQLASNATSSDRLVAATASVGLARSTLEWRSKATIIVAGRPHLGRRTLLESIALDAGMSVLAIDTRRLAKDANVMATQLRAVARECRLLARVPLIANLEGDDERMELIGSELVANVDGPVLVTAGVQRPRIDWGRPVIAIEMEPPTTAQRTQLWKGALGEIGDVDADHLATSYPLAPGLIVRAADAAKARASGRPLEAKDVHAGIRAVLDDRLGQYAKRVTVTQTWDDLVLPAEQVEPVVELMARIRERRRVYEDWGFAAKVGKGLGVSALFSGPPGTGKTMVAALIAKDLGLELYQVDLGKVVSKYIGETEKNLAALFDAAEAGHAVLLFDEADALFGKRTEVKSSNDRYANLETNYLLQRLESFTGICLLTSNHETNIDPAFLRRLSLHLRFELPDVAERAQLWRAMLPKAAPVAAGLDVDSLARRFAMSGGYIRNAALRAAFLAANDGTPITIAHLERAARSEYEGMGKIAAA